MDDWCVARLGDKKTVMALTYTIPEVVYRKKPVKGVISLTHECPN
jgi:hypothetical protein